MKDHTDVHDIDDNAGAGAGADDEVDGVSWAELPEVHILSSCTQGLKTHSRAGGLKDHTDVHDIDDNAGAGAGAGAGADDEVDEVSWADLPEVHILYSCTQGLKTNRRAGGLKDHKDVHDIDAGAGANAGAGGGAGAGVNDEVDEVS